MSRENRNASISHWDGQGPCQDPKMKDLETDFIVHHAEGLGLSFSNNELERALGNRICNTESLPRPWGWAVARKMPVVRN